MDVASFTPCDLNNYCIFQGVNYQFDCDGYTRQCSEDARYSQLDGTFICNFHLGKYFRILKSKFEIPSGGVDNRSFKMLVGQSLVPYAEKSTDPGKRLLIPMSVDDVRLAVSSRSLMERFVFYTIYEDEDKLKSICDEITNQEEIYSTSDTWESVNFNINSIINMATPNRLFCPPKAKMLYSYTSDESFKKLPKFLQNLVQCLVKPVKLEIGTFSLVLETANTCSFTDNGLAVPELHNPNQPIRADRRTRKPLFEIRTVQEFDGRAVAEQRVLDMYDEVILSRPLLNGTHTYKA
ncbi:capsid protein VP39 [Phthorimaea operculella granulovirus]|uniref:Capsid protein VP39 n=1 Tax=Phthorimaea operculella granulovirus TaxID=192584 RepID=Q8JRX1_9BBAC|nr:capsid protein VP39 [Phthorimaea operculella granulovirus]AAM70286.1 capsid protein VP39 [Phthorimaea operculella granulovirus]QBH66053.1 capsid protein VP39 [Phthorimaea operculella granulovirus]QBH66183.1 capsid protein VP39 [Phthorimaea operculella granulovirus]QBH66313.1 capsid protein VP39 [Phthorimaea operculella granulovirus]QBH66443.1 capsid protein VP39 [Phthorimaea operculella granulovirus]